MLSSNPETTPFLIIAVVILIFSAVISAWSIYLMVVHKRKWYYVLPLLLWSVHLAIFYCFVIHAFNLGTSLNDLYKIEDFAEIWSAVQRLHGMITITYLTYILHLEMSK